MKNGCLATTKQLPNYMHMAAYCISSYIGPDIHNDPLQRIQ